MLVDIENAFNSIPRSLVLKGLKKFCPEIIPFFTALHRTRSTLCLSTGETVGYSSTGVRQGDPMAMIYVAVGILDILVEIQGEFEDEAVKRGRPPSELGGIVAYADDINLSAPDWLLPRMFNTLMVKLGQASMNVQLSKCKVLCPTGDKPLLLPDLTLAVPAQLREDMPPEITIVMDGIIVLGAPVGTPEYIQTTTIKIIKAYLEDIEGINHLHKSSAYALLKMCINQRPNFLRRCSPMNETMDSMFNGFVQNRCCNRQNYGTHPHGSQRQDCEGSAF
jgi:hypothetical protein